MDTLAITNVRASYRRNGAAHRLDVLRGVNFAARQGEVIALRGASGAGKSTFLAIVGGMLQPDAGRVQYAGADIYSLEERSLSSFRGRSVGFLFQLDFLLPNYTIEENINMALHYAGCRPAEAPSRVAEVLAQVALAARREHLPDELSGGERHRAALARAIVHGPSLILADEPTGNLDRQNATQILDLLWRQRDRGAIVIVATHDDWVAGQADRAIELRDGMIREGVR